MHPVVYYLVVLIALGAVGMALANRKIDIVTKRQRWLKFFTYILITGFVILSIVYHFFNIVSIVIAILIFWELYHVNSGVRFKPMGQVLLSFVITCSIAILFICFGNNFDSQFILFIYLQVLVFDAFCQISGQLFGKHQLVPKTSPSKTVEGLIGGLIICVCCAIFTSAWINSGKSVALLYGCTTAATSFAGDILASMYKRKVSVKDYSRLLPGQGGVLDRFDSFLITGAIYFIVYKFR